MTGAAASGPGFGPTPIRGRQGRRFLAAIGIAVALHALVLVSGPPSPGQGAALTGAMRRALIVRTLALDVAPSRQIEPSASSRPRAPEIPQGVARESHVPKVDVARPPAARPERAAAIPQAPVAAGPSGVAEPTSAAPPPLSADALPPAPGFLRGNALDVPPRPLNDIDPVYPDEGQMRSGSVVLRLLIDERGDVVDAAVVRSFPKAVFDASALGAFGSAKFSPGQRGGAAVKSQLTIEVEFTPMNRGAGVSGRSY